LELLIYAILGFIVLYISFQIFLKCIDWYYAVIRFSEKIDREIESDKKEKEKRATLKKARLQEFYDEDEIAPLTPKKKNNRYANLKKDPLKHKGDIYERFIGRKFEAKGDLVIYNGFIQGYNDKGIDIITVSQESKSIHLIQCKNWTKKPMLLDDVKNIYHKLNTYDNDFLNLDTQEINNFLRIKRDEDNIKSILNLTKKNISQYTVRKTLYVGSDKVVDLNIGKHLIMINSKIFKYDDMKIVIQEYQ